MSMTTLPDLSTWYRVPVGATIPAFSAYAYASKDTLMVELRGRFEDITVNRDSAYYTEFPVTPPLPTEEGATILASDDCRRPRILLTLEAGQWVSGLGLHWNVEQLRAWCPVTLGETVVMR